jgi:hypothetical protein
MGMVVPVPHIPRSDVTKRGIVGAVADAAAMVAVGMPAAHTDGHGVGSYGVGANDVNVRDHAPGQTGCGVRPSISTCPNVLNRVNAGDIVSEICQQPGQTVGGSPYWVLVSTPDRWTGWMASYYIEYKTIWIDGVGQCQ